MAAREGTREGTSQPDVLVVDGVTDGVAALGGRGRRDDHVVPEGGGAAAVPLPGGGYCFCDAGCDDDYTDNNSHGSCCADHAWRCLGGDRDPLCLDARTQAQALNLFVAHAVIDQLQKVSPAAGHQESSAR